ncbi:MAG TPA: ABC transporter substrate-binding protein [Anaerolineaceae bacterium]|jgi:NitT/TauT family transport system substrate-binding protein
MKITHKILLISILTGLFSGCAAQLAAPKAAPLKLALLPILDVMPIYVAQEAGFFEKQGLKVEFVPVGSAAEREQVVAAGQADGMVNDLLSVALYNRKDTQVQMVQFARITAAGAPLYCIVASKQSGIKTVKDLAGVAIGISQGTIIDYVTNQVLISQGLQPDQIQTLAVPKLPDRLALLISGQLKAATLPEPFSTEAVQQGAVLIVDDTGYPDIANSVISFRKKVLDEQPQAVQKFLAAINQAVNEINNHPETWRKILDTYKLVPANLVQTYPIPKFPAASLPTQQQFDAVVQWAIAKGMIDQKVDYASSVKTP